MKTWKNSIVIHSAPEKVFAYIDEVTNLPDWLPSMIEIRDVIGTGEGQQFEWTYKMAGLLLRGQSIIIERVPGKCGTHQSIGMIHSTFTYIVEPHDEGTELCIDFEYNVPIPVLGRLAEVTIIKRNIREFDTALTNVKETIEG